MPAVAFSALRPALSPPVPLSLLSLPHFLFFPPARQQDDAGAWGQGASYLDCFCLQFEPVERVDGLVGIVRVNVVYETVAQALTCNVTQHGAL